jgi:hypothetical protein
MPTTDAEPATLQCFSLVSLTLDDASASSVSVAPHSLLKLSGETSGGSKSIASKASSSEPVTILAAKGEKGNGSKGAPLDMMTIFGVNFFPEL